MANARLSLLATQFQTNAAAVAGSAAGGIVTSDIQALAAVLALLANRLDHSIPLLGAAVTPATASTMLTPS